MVLSRLIIIVLLPLSLLSFNNDTTLNSAPNTKILLPTLTPEERLAVTSFDELVKSLDLSERISPHIEYYSQVLSSSTLDPAKKQRFKLLLINKAARSIHVKSYSLGSPIQSVNVTGNGYFLCLLSNGRIVLIDEHTGAQGSELGYNQFRATAACCDEEKIVGIFNNRHVRIWRHGNQLNQKQHYQISDFSLPLEYGTINAVQVMKNILILGLANGEVVSFDLLTNKLYKKISFEHTALPIESMMPYDQSKILVKTNCSLSVVDMLMGQVIFTKYGTTTAASAFDDNQLLVGYQTGMFELINIYSQEILNSYQGHMYIISSLAGAHKNSIISGSGDCLIKLWHPLLTQEVASLGMHYDTITSIVPSSDEKHIITASYDGILSVWAFTPVNLLELCSLPQLLLLTKLSKAQGECVLHKSWYKEYKHLDPWLKEMLDSHVAIKQKNSLFNLGKEVNLENVIESSDTDVQSNTLMTK